MLESDWLSTCVVGQWEAAETRAVTGSPAWLVVGSKHLCFEKPSVGKRDNYERGREREREFENIFPAWPRGPFYSNRI